MSGASISLQGSLETEGGDGGDVATTGASRDGARGDDAAPAGAPHAATSRLQRTIARRLTPSKVAVDVSAVGAAAR